MDIEKWDRLALEYGEWVERNADDAGRVFADSIRRAILCRLPADRRTKVLDLGCGSGALLEELDRRYEVLVGCDGSRQMIALARALHPVAAARTLVADATRTIPFVTGAFDLVVASMVLMCLDDVSTVLREVSRALRPGGEFVFTVTHPCFSFVRRSLEFGEHRYLDSFASEHRLGPTFASTVSHYHRPLQFYFEALRSNGLVVRSIAEISRDELPEGAQAERLRPYHMTANAMLFHADRV